MNSKCATKESLSCVHSKAVCYLTDDRLNSSRGPPINILCLLPGAGTFRVPVSFYLMRTKHYSLASKKFLEHIVGPDHPHLKGSRNEVRRQVVLALSSELHVYIYVTSSRWTLKINVHFYCFPRLLRYVFLC